MKKRRFQNVLAGLLVLTMGFLLSSCGSPAQTGETPSSSGNPGAAAGETYAFTLAHHHAVDSVTDHLCTDFARLVSEKTNGAVEVTVYPSAQLGSEQEVADGLLVGTQQFGAITAAVTYVDNVDGFGADTLPFMFSDWEEIYYAFNEASQPVGAALNEKLMEQGARILCWGPCGGRQMIFVDKNVTSYKQMNGMTMRSPESTLYTDMFKALGSAPTPITWSECYTAMQTKVAEGMETPISSIKDMNFCEVTQYGLLTNHMWSTITLAVSNGVYDSLPEEYQRAVEEAAQEAGAIAYEEGKESEAEDLAFCVEKGMVFNELPEGETEELAELMVAMKERWLEGHPGRQEIYDLCLKAVEEYAAR